jgi:hypothetical protein
MIVVNWSSASAGESKPVTAAALAAVFFLVVVGAAAVAVGRVFCFGSITVSAPETTSGSL